MLNFNCLYSLTIFRAAVTAKLKEDRQASRLSLQPTRPVDVFG